ncbi:MAG: fibronectin type III domain-containing protein, partial [Candidatus Neomarinimicrobiota bacterium]
MKSFAFLVTILHIFSNLSAQVPSAPSNFVATASSGGDAIELTWTDNSNNELWFEIEREVDDDDNWIDVVNKTENATEHTDSGLGAGSYEYRIRSANASGSSDWVYSSVVILPCAPPSNFVATASSGGDAIFLSWTDNSNNELWFEIEREV